MRKYRIIILMGLQLMGLNLYAQKNDGTWRIEEAGTITQDFENIAYYKRQKLPFRDIIILDKRFDSSKAGYANVLFGKSKYSRIIPKDSWAMILNAYFRNNLDSTSAQSLVIIIKSYWLQKGAVDEIIKKKMVQKPMFGNSDFGGVCTAALDIYVQSGATLQALFKIDTSFINLINNFNKNRIEEFFFLPFDSVARKLTSLNIPDILAKKRNLSWEEVNAYYNNRFNLPVLKDPAIKKGIFLSFNDFKNNTAYNTEFKFRSGKLTDELYAVDKDKEELITDYWGFFDGFSLYVRIGFNAFRAVKQQDTFELFGAKHISNYHNNPSQNDIKIVSYGLDEKILQVNMDNGKIY